MNLFRFIYFSLITLFGALVLMPMAYAQTVSSIPVVVGPFSPYPSTFNPFLNPQTISTAASDGVKLATAANVAVSAAGVGVQAGVLAEASLGTAAIVARAIGCTTVIGAIGCVATAATIVNQLNNAAKGYHACSASQGFFCKDDNGSTSNGDIVITLPYEPAGFNGVPLVLLNQSSANTVCRDRYPSTSDFKWQGVANIVETLQVKCVVSQNVDGSASFTAGGGTAFFCGAGYFLDTAKNSCQPGTKPTVEVALSRAEVVQSMNDQIAKDFQENKKLYDAFRRDQASVPSGWPESSIVPPATPQFVTVTPTQSPATVTGTHSAPAANGGTDTTQNTQQLFVLGTRESNTVADAPKITGQLISIGAVTNSTTGATTSSTTTQNFTNNTTNTNTNVATQPVAAPDTGPHECGSPGKPPCKIDETGTPTAAVSQSVFAEPTKVINDSIQAAKDAITPLSTLDDNKFKWNFSLQLPNNCATFPLFLGIVVDFCKYRDVCHDLMSMVWAGGTFWAIANKFGRTMRGGA